MRLAEVNAFGGEGRPVRHVELAPPLENKQKIAYGLGVVATPYGYEQAKHISMYVPSGEYYDGTTPEVYRYRQLDRNSVGAVNTREQWAKELKDWEEEAPNVIRAQE